MNLMQEWILTLLTFSPLLGVLVLLFLPREKGTIHRIVGTLATLPSLILSVWIFIHYVTTKAFPKEELVNWFSIAVDSQNKWQFPFHLAIDGISMPLVLMTCVVSLVAAIASILYIKQRTKEYYVWFLLLEVGMIGIFLAQNLLLFFLFLEITLVSMFFLIGIWGLLGREKAAYQYLIYNGLGSALLLFALVGMIFLFGTLDYSHLKGQIISVFNQYDQLPAFEQGFIWGVFLCLWLAFAIKLPVFPFHSWMLRVHMEAAPPVVMIHAGILLKIGAYGMLRFGVGLFPTLLKPMAFWLALFGLVNVLYGGILAFVQKELRGVLAYSSISHMGIILLGISAMNLEGFEGALLQSVSHGYISALLFFLVGSLYERTKTTVLEDLGGLGKTVPLLAGFLLTAGLALLGLPGLSGFISEFFALIGLFAVKPVVGTVATLGIILAAVYTLRAVMRITFGGLSERGESLADLRRSEWMAMLVLLVFIVAIGVYPNFVVQPTASPLQMMVSQIGG